MYIKFFKTAHRESWCNYWYLGHLNFNANSQKALALMFMLKKMFNNVVFTSHALEMYSYYGLIPSGMDCL
jgi:hypothetical protein